MAEEKKGSAKVIPTPEGYREGGKLFFDLMKHLTTLSTGSLLLLVAFLEKLFPNPCCRWMIISVLCSLLLSVLGSLLAMLAIILADLKGSESFV